MVEHLLYWPHRPAIYVFAFGQANPSSAYKPGCLVVWLLGRLVYTIEGLECFSHVCQVHTTVDQCPQSKAASAHTLVSGFACDSPTLLLFSYVGLFTLYGPASLPFLPQESPSPKSLAPALAPTKQLRLKDSTFPQSSSIGN